MKILELHFLERLFLAGLALSVKANPLPSAISSKNFDFSEIQPCEGLEWYPCQGSFFCAVLDVPLDYSKPFGNRAYVPLIKLPAQANSTYGPYKGMVLTNPGGPGGSGVQFVLDSGVELQTIIGTNYDLVAWDPRGIGASIPSANCSALPLSKSMTRNNRRELPPIYGPELANSFFVDTFADAKAVGERCQAIIGGDNDAGPHMTTAVNVRDMVSIVDAFSRTPEGKGVHGAHLLNYWGFSYGTYIGQTFGSMFPDRVGRVIVDGIVDANIYRNGIIQGSFDPVFSTFFLYCNLAGPTACPYYTGTTALDIYNRFENTLIQLDAQHAAAQNWTNATVIQEALELVKGLLDEVSYDPIVLFPEVSDVALYLETALKNGDLVQVIETLGTPAPPSNSTGYFRAVACTDSAGVLYNKTIQELQPIISAEENDIISGEILSSLPIECTGWPIIGHDVYLGPFGGNTRNPMLFISNTLDPITPLANGQKAFPNFKGAQLLTIQGQGHSSLAANNQCANEKIQTLFQTGILPGNDSLCPQEAGAFNVTLPSTTEKRGEWKRIRERLGKLTRDLDRRMF